MGEQRHWLDRFPGGYIAEIVVLVLLAVGVATYRFDLGDRLGWGTADPATEPAAVQPPEGLKLPSTGAARAVARPGSSVDAVPARVAAAVQPMLQRKRVLGRHVGALVTDLETGAQLYRYGATSITPASTTKVLTTTAALESLGPMARFRTTVRYVPRTHQLVLVGGGDPFLASSPRKARGSYPDRSDVVTLAQKVVRRLRATKVARVRLGFDDSYFTGPAVNPAWPAS